MGQILHGSATTTEAVRRAIQHSQASLRALAKRYGINPKTVAKWKKRGSSPTFRPALRRCFNGSQHRGRSGDRRLPQAYAAAAGRLPVRASADHPASHALVVAPLLAAPRVSRLPQVEGEASPKRKFKAYPIGYFHIDIAEVRTAEASSISLSPSTGPRSSPLSNSARRSPGATPQTSCVG